MKNLDPRSFALEKIRTTTREFEWNSGVSDAWTSQLRARLSECIGIDQLQMDALQPEIHSESQEDGFRKLTVTFGSQPGMRVFAYLLIPDGTTSPGPAVVCVPGHGAGVDALVGTAELDYQNQFALQFVRQGLVTLAIEPISFGHRKSEVDKDKGSSCLRDSMAALMLGQSMIAWRTWDAIAAFNYLSSRPEVDSNNIGIVGISGGGLVAFWAACLEPRYAAAVVSGYFNTFFDSIISIEHCSDNFACGLAKVVEMPDMVALIAPRKLFVESGTEDHIFPAEAFKAACQRAEVIYESVGASASFKSELFQGDHVFWGKQALPQLKTWLS